MTKKQLVNKKRRERRDNIIGAIILVAVMVAFVVMGGNAMDREYEYNKSQIEEWQNNN